MVATQTCYTFAGVFCSSHQVILCTNHLMSVCEQLLRLLALMFDNKLILNSLGVFKVFYSIHFMLIEKKHNEQRSKPAKNQQQEEF